MLPSTYVLLILIGLIPMIPAVIFFIRKRNQQLVRATKGLLVGLGGFNVVIGLMALALGIIWLATPTGVSANNAIQTTTADPYATLAAALSTGLQRLRLELLSATQVQLHLALFLKNPNYLARH
jgi:hypothetical protein